MTRRLLPATFLFATLAIALSGCDPTPDPTGSSSPSSTEPGTSGPTAEPVAVAPARADLAISPEGMGTLVFGEAPPSSPAQAMLVLDPDYCLDSNAGLGTGFSPGSPEAALWVPVPEYRDGLYGDFGVLVEGGAVQRIDVFGNDIPTTLGVRVGDHRTEVDLAYPDADIQSFGLTDIYVIAGTHGVLQIEVAKQPGGGSDDYWQDSEVGYVQYIHAVAIGDAVFSVAASENIAGGCPF